MDRATKGYIAFGVLLVVLVIVLIIIFVVMPGSNSETSMSNSVSLDYSEPASSSSSATASSSSSAPAQKYGNIVWGGPKKGPVGEFYCPDGLSEDVTIRAGWGVDGIKVSCKDGSNKMYGGQGGNPRNTKITDKGIYVSYNDNYISNMTPMNEWTGNRNKYVAGYGTGEGQFFPTKVAKLSCDPGYEHVGYQFTANNNLLTGVALKCKSVSG